MRRDASGANGHVTAKPSIIRPRHGVKGNPAQIKSQAALLEKIAHSVAQ
jgi:hypothetical protein